MVSPNEKEDLPTGLPEKKSLLARNVEIINEAVLLRDHVPKKEIESLDNEITILDNDSQKMVSQICFHPFENILVVSDENDGIIVWNWENGNRLNQFQNQNPIGSRITSLTLLNEQDSTIIAAGSDNGVVRVWSGIEDSTNTKLVTAWRVLGDLIPVRGYAHGMVLEWQKCRQFLVASGNVDILKLWDLNKELAVQDIPTECPTIPITSITSDDLHGSGNLIVAGGADGSVRLFDRRLNNKFGLIHVLSEHKGWIINVCMPTYAKQQIISGAGTGDVKIWDLRNTKFSAKTISAHPTPCMSAFCVHDYANIFAIGSQDQRIRVLNLDGSAVSVIRYHDGFLGQRIGPVTALKFHPFKVILGAGASDSLVSVYESQ
eukprot:TRINITY_DN7695_c0_g1_i1.p1 TRINITY_DN7695_c0_g1~~TRINITY_DN7695_c0_g1_i1.p1  ORF type:complete len:375 (-),score=89.47 TRINITY_DN7695_c0_g1_i1:119-1243(-)